MITFAKLLESGVLNQLYDDSIETSSQKKTTYEICDALSDLSKLTSKIIDVLINLKNSGYIEEELKSDVYYYSLTKTGIDYAKNIFQNLSNQASEMEKYYKKMLPNRNTAISFSDDTVSLTASFGNNISIKKNEEDANE